MNPDRARSTFGQQFEIVRGDVQDRSSLRAALADCDGVHVNLAGGPSAADFDRIENRGTALVAGVAAELGVGRLTYLSGAPAAAENSRDPGSLAKFQRLWPRRFHQARSTRDLSQGGPSRRQAHLPAGTGDEAGRVALIRQLRADVARMAFYDTIGDDFGDDTETTSLLGRPTTTLTEWCRRSATEDQPLLG